MKIAHMQAVAHDVAHHAQSTQSPLRLSLHRVCQSSGVAAVTINLLAAPHYPTELPHDADLARALEHLRRAFGDILRGRGFQPADLTAAWLSVAFAETFPELDLFSTHARLEAGGRTFEKEFPLPSGDVLAGMQREKGMTLSDRITTRAQLAEAARSPDPSHHRAG